MFFVTPRVDFLSQVEDDVVLKYIPYFGDDDEGFDTSLYEGYLPADTKCDSDEDDMICSVLDVSEFEHLLRHVD